MGKRGTSSSSPKPPPPVKAKAKTPASAKPKPKPKATAKRTPAKAKAKAEPTFEVEVIPKVATGVASPNSRKAQYSRENSKPTVDLPVNPKADMFWQGWAKPAPPLPPPPKAAMPMPPVSSVLREGECDVVVSGCLAAEASKPSASATHSEEQHLAPEEEEEILAALADALDNPGQEETETCAATTATNVADASAVTASTDAQADEVKVNSCEPEKAKAGEVNVKCEPCEPEKAQADEVKVKCEPCEPEKAVDGSANAQPDDASEIPPPPPTPSAEVEAGMMDEGSKMDDNADDVMEDDDDAHNLTHDGGDTPFDELPLLEQFADESLELIIKKYGGDTLEMSLISLPRTIRLMSACSGSGCFELATHAALCEINRRFKRFRMENQDTDPFHFKVSTSFLCEIVPNKQKFLLEHVIKHQVETEEETPCLFENIINLNDGETRRCIVHSAACELDRFDPKKGDADDLSIFAAGFSCKSFSKMNINFTELRTALADQKECSSLATFRGVLHIVRECRPRIVLLENVDSIDSSVGQSDSSDKEAKSNLQVVLTQISELGYSCRAEKLKASEYGVPQRRTRYYFVCVRQNGGSALSEPADLLVERIMDRVLSLRRECRHNPDYFLLPDSHGLVQIELNRRVSKKKDGEAKDKAAWPEQHSALAEKYGVQWPLQPSKELASSVWYDVLPDREKEVLCFVNIMNERITNVDDKIQYVDISQSATRLPTSTRGSQVTPTILPGSKLWHVGRKRLLLGTELMALQGLPMTEFPENILTTLSQKQCADLAGNMFAVPCVMAVVMSALSTLRFETYSEEEELDAVASSMQKWCKS